MEEFFFSGVDNKFRMFLIRHISQVMMVTKFKEERAPNLELIMLLCLDDQMSQGSLGVIMCDSCVTLRKPADHPIYFLSEHPVLYRKTLMVCRKAQRNKNQNKQGFKVSHLTQRHSGKDRLNPYASKAARRSFRTFRLLFPYIESKVK